VDEMKKREIYALLLFCGILLTSGFLGGLVYSQTSGTFYISEGIYPSGVEFSIWRDGSNYYAKDGYGLVAYSGTNATQIIQNAYDNAENGGTIYLKTSSSSFSLDSTILMSGTSKKLLGERGTILTQENNADLMTMINITGNENEIHNINFDGNGANQNNGTIPILITGNRNIVSTLMFYNFHTSDGNFPSSAVHIWGGARNSVSKIIVNSLDGGGFAYGSIRNTFRDASIYTPKTHGWTITSSQPLKPTSNPADHSTSYGNIVNDVRIYDSQGIGFAIDGDSEFNIISNIYVEGAVADGINCEGWASVGAPSHNVLSNLIIKNARLSLASTTGNEVHNITVTNVNIETAITETPIYINHAFEVTLSNIIVFGDEVWVNASTRLTITNFHSWRSGGAGIRIQNGYDTVIQGFIIENAYYAGISLSVNAFFSISDGVIRSSGVSGSNDYGIRVVSTDNSTISNVVSRDNDYGIFLEATADYNLIHGNQLSGNAVDTIKQAGTGNSYVDNFPDNGAP